LEPALYLRKYAIFNVMRVWLENAYFTPRFGDKKKKFYSFINPITWG